LRAGAISCILRAASGIPPLARGEVRLVWLPHQAAERLQRYVWPISALKSPRSLFGRLPARTQSTSVIRMGPTRPEGVTELLDAWRQGVPDAADRLAAAVSSHLRRIAAGYLRRERPRHTLQPTELVHEAYLRLVGQQRLHDREG
jgi:hypothetical protein